jgi:DNA-binding XRE family transcriptional regulator
MTRIQIIERNGKPAFYLVPAATWERVRETIEDAEDAIEYEQAIESDDGLRFPLPVAMALAEGVHAVRAFREYRQMTQDQLARTSGLSKPFLSQIEGRVRAPSLAALRRLAAALEVPVGVLTDE